MAKQPAKKEPKLPRARSAITGRFVSVWFAVWHPHTTIIEKRRKKK